MYIGLRSLAVLLGLGGGIENMHCQTSSQGSSSRLALTAASDRLLRARVRPMSMSMAVAVGAPMCSMMRVVYRVMR